MDPTPVTGRPPPHDDSFDIAIVGGGPAGLSAAVAAGRLNRRAVCFEAGTPRSAHAPGYFNYLGFPDGISGKELLRLGREQAHRWGAELRDLAVTSVDAITAPQAAVDGDLREGSRRSEDASTDGRFLVRTEEGSVRCCEVIFATGIQDRQPTCGSLYGERGIHYCVVCDGYETRGQRVAVVGHDETAFGMIRALRDFTSDLHFLLDGNPWALGAEERACLAEWGVEVRAANLETYRCSPEGVFFRTEEGEELYPHVFVALGSDPNSALAAKLGCELDDKGFIVTDERQATSVLHAFAAGDCDGGHKQVTQAMAEGELAAVEAAKLLRESETPPAVTRVAG